MTNRQYPTNDFTPIESLDALAEDLQRVQDRGRSRFLAEAAEDLSVKGAVFSISKNDRGIFELTVKLSPPVWDEVKSFRYKKMSADESALQKYAKQMIRSIKTGASLVLDGWAPMQSESLGEAKEPAKLKGKKLDALIQKLYSKHGNGVQVNIFNLSKISNAGRAAYETGGEEAADKAIAAAIEQYREN